MESMTNLSARQLNKLNKSAKRQGKKGAETIIIVKQSALKSKKTMIEPKMNLPTVPESINKNAKSKSDI